MKSKTGHLNLKPEGGGFSFRNLPHGLYARNERIPRRLL